MNGAHPKEDIHLRRLFPTESLPFGVSLDGDGGVLIGEDECRNTAVVVVVVAGGGHHGSM